MREQKLRRTNQKVPVRELSKQNSQLQQFPTIKLHILNQIQSLDLSKNRIENFSSLTIHYKTSQHVLKNLLNINIAFNQIKSCSQLKPLAQTALNIQIINVEGNPLTKTLNFLFEIISMFPNIRCVKCQDNLQITPEVKKQVFYTHLNGGKAIKKFIKYLKINLSEILSVNIRKIVFDIQSIIKQLQEYPQSVIECNRRIFNAIEKFIAIREIQQHYTYRSPIADKKNQIQVITTYQIQQFSQHLQINSQQNQKYQGWFYLKSMAQSSSVCYKILQQIQLDEQTFKLLQLGQINILKSETLVFELLDKWNKQSNMIQFIKEPNSKKISTVKSVFTADNTERDQEYTSSNFEDMIQNCYFGLDRQWSIETMRFISGKLLNFTKKLIEYEYRGYNSEEYSIASQSQNSNSSNFFKCVFDKNQQKYIQNKSEVIFQSPKSQNKFIMASCLRVLEQTIKRIVFRKINSSHTCKQTQLIIFEKVIIKMIDNLKRVGLRKIFEDALLMKFIREKLDRNKINRVFNAWKKIKIRRLKLLQKIIKQKNKKQRAFQSILITKWRIITRHIATTMFAKQRLQEVAASSLPLAQLSCIKRNFPEVTQRNNQKIRRSATFYRLETMRNSKIKVHRISRIN